MVDGTPPTRVVAGAVVPAEGWWAIDPDHVYVEFSADRLAIASIRARFGSVSGQVHIAAEPADSSVEMVVATASVNSGSADRDERLRSTEHLDVARHPTATFRSTGLSWNGRRASVEGELTIVEVTNPVVFDIDYRGTVVDPWGVERSVFAARGVIDREDWGLTWNVTVEGGGLLVSREVLVEVDVETVRMGRHRDAASTSLGATC